MCFPCEYPSHRKTFFLRCFILKPTKKASVLKSGTRNFKNRPPFERSACFYVKIAENVERF